MWNSVRDRLYSMIKRAAKISAALFDEMNTGNGISIQQIYGLNIPHKLSGNRSYHSHFVNQSA